tara:strand:- start:107 stop:409 length:303 start_codon:yes stop_codon:yes gene_type:complete
MFIAMNRFKIVKGKEEIFEEIWKNRESDLNNVKGFLEFHLIKGSKSDDYTLYASHSKWSSEESFVEWTRSESFRKSHKNSNKYKEIYMGHPIFEGFKVII